MDPVWEHQKYRSKIYHRGYYRVGTILLLLKWNEWEEILSYTNILNK